MIKTFETFNELDPYNEEDWDDGDVFNKGDRVICTNNFGDETNYLKKNKEYRINGVHNDRFIEIEGPYDYYLYSVTRFKKIK